MFVVRRVYGGRMADHIREKAERHEFVVQPKSSSIGIRAQSDRFVAPEESSPDNVFVSIELVSDVMFHTE
jgi:hypothetical protein